MSQPGVLRVAQLNMGSLLEPGWEERRHEILAWFERLDPDVVCLQEVWENTAEPGSNTAAWLAGNAPEGRWHWCFGGFEFPEDAWPGRDLTGLRFGSAILSRWPIDRTDVVLLPVDPAPRDPHPSWRMRAELLYAHTAGADVFSTHLAPPPAQAYQRIHQVLAIDDAIRERQTPGVALPPILCGDFNAKPQSDEMRFLKANAVLDGRSTHYVDAWETLRPTEAGYTYDPLTNPQARFLNVPPQRIDYLFVGDMFLRPEGAGRILAVDLAFHEPLTGRHASDHYGLVADVRWPQKPEV
ncbi:endonuclease/exonuclease/phosphatase family protein [Nocardia sp. 2]|uniref:Endonuclease/exonuclease/phosphatase family protein n=1 Tax=Nocardia acididurans TaxID=2802282 RepID=A0ABS1LZQ2_9NOCA|nr:endonuclease/exonuclease/phosphatase family protein [Nocardia acididurans]MBL1073736.1 endonuclease/exonuclease/phosphatase family protein [Nocardia acididurans]